MITHLNSASAVVGSTLRFAMLLVLLVAAASPAQSADHGAASATNTASVTIASFAYSPEELTVAVGTTVTWTNNDAAPHDVVSDDRSTIVSSLLATGERFSQRFDRPGSFSYFCTLHPSMRAVITVERGRVFLPLVRGVES